jgi:hypothetical protein
MYMFDTKAMNILEDHGKIPLETLKDAVTLALAGTDAPSLCRMQRAKHLYKCLLKSVSTKFQDSLDPDLKEIKQDGPLYFKYIMMEVASTQAPKLKHKSFILSCMQTFSRS